MIITFWHQKSVESVVRNILVYYMNFYAKYSRGYQQYSRLNAKKIFKHK